MSKNTSPKSLSYEDSKKLAADDDIEIRASVAARSDLEREVLYFLAQDESVEVRRSVAENLSAPHQTIGLLVLDKEEKVRRGLIAKIAAITPHLDKDEDGELSNSACNALSILANDQIVHVREAMAAEFKDMDEVPTDVIRTLAVDVEVSVSTPVLEHSPVLTDNILLEIIEEGTVSDNLCAISRRKSVSESISGALVGTKDTPAISELLSNPSAQIREEVLDDLIDRAAGVDVWHEPLVKRPTLPMKAPQKLAKFISVNLIGMLKSRNDMDEETLAEVETLLRDRLDDNNPASSSAGLSDYLNGPISLEQVERLQRSDGLHPSVISSALRAGDHNFVLASLISRSGLSEAIVKRIFTERNSKGIVSLVWKSKLPVSMIVSLQHRIARIPPDDVLEPTKGGIMGNTLVFPISEKEMAWNIQFFTDLVDREAHA